MSGWPLVTLGEVFDIARGGSPRPIDDFITDDPAGINWIMIGDASEGSKYITGTRKRIRPEGAQRSRAVKPGDFLLTNSMSFGKPYIMRTSGCIHDGWLMLSPRRGDVDADFFYHLLGSNAVYSEFERRAAGATVKNLNIELVRGVKIHLPPLPEQRRIAETLDKADALRAKRRATLAQLDTLTQSIFLDLFGDPATNPKGWVQRCVGRIGTVTTGNTPPRDDPGNYGNAIEWIKSDNLNTGSYYATQASEGLSEEGMACARIAPAGAILVTCIAGSPSSIGNAAMVDRPVAFNQQINALVPGDGNPHFFFAQLKLGKRLVQQASTGGMKGLVSKGRFEKVLLMQPPPGLQDRFSELALRIEAMKSGLYGSLAQVEALFAALQHRAFKGDL